jgi:hypothetical protein
MMTKTMFSVTFRAMGMGLTFSQKAWTFAHGFDRFWFNFTPFETFFIL